MYVIKWYGEGVVGGVMEVSTGVWRAGGWVVGKCRMRFENCPGRVGLGISALDGWVVGFVRVY